MNGKETEKTAGQNQTELQELKPQEEKTFMTIKKLAEVLGVTERTVKNAARAKGVEGTFSPLQTNGGTQAARVYNEEEATAIKQEIQKHHNLPSRKIDRVTTEIEENRTITQAFQILQRRNTELQARCEAAESLNRRLMHTEHLYTVTEIAKELGLTSGAKLNEILEKRGVQYKVNGTWVPTSRYTECGYFEIKQQVHDDTGYVYYDRKVTQEGRRFILELLGA